MKYSVYRVVEIAVGCCAAIALSMALGLHNSISAGIITILSIQNTKRETLSAAVERLVAFGIAAGIALGAFGLLGYSLAGFGLYLLLFTAVCYHWQLQAALPICSVLVSHFWIAGHMQLAFIGNEALLMLIGTAVGVLLNLFLPRNVQAIRQEQADIEEALRGFFHDFAKVLRGWGEVSVVAADLAAIDARLTHAEAQADALAKNSLLSDARYYVQYVEMRRHQQVILTRMVSALEALAYAGPEMQPMAEMMEEIAQALHERNDAVRLLSSLATLRQYFRASELPGTRAEFEARATLYRILIDTEHFLLIKKSFVDSLSPEQRRLLRSDRSGQ